MNSRRLIAIGIVVLLAILLAPDTAAAQCAMCRRALDSPEGRQLIGALRRGILVLFAAPFLLFGIVATLAVRVQRKACAPLSTGKHDGADTFSDAGGLGARSDRDESTPPVLEHGSFGVLPE